MSSDGRAGWAAPGSGRQPRARRLSLRLFLLVLIGVPVLEVFVFIEVGRAIGWLLAVLLLVGISLLGTQLARIQGRIAIERISQAVSERRAPGRVRHRRARRAAHASAHAGARAALAIASLRRSSDELRLDRGALHLARRRRAAS
jgi:hypothetical protein